MGDLPVLSRRCVHFRHVPRGTISRFSRWMFSSESRYSFLLTYLFRRRNADVWSSRVSIEFLSMKQSSDLRGSERDPTCARALSGFQITTPVRLPIYSDSSISISNQPKPTSKPSTEVTMGRRIL